MNPQAPVEKHSAFLGTRYEQDGKPLDNADMLEQLHKEPQPDDELAGQSAFAVTSIILAAVGGALIGWPIGQAIAGKEKPLWPLAGVGGGFIAVSIPFGIVSANKVDNAVDAHNRATGTAHEE